MEKIIIRGKEYRFIKDYKNNNLLRNSLNLLTQSIFGFNFEVWYTEGFWGDFYIPYSIFDNDKIVANVSVSVMDCEVLNEVKRYVQLGTVMTDVNYRNQGLSEYLINKVIEEWKNKSDMIYLFANDSVLKFYPKFGFEAACEYEYSKKINSKNNTIKTKKLDMSLKESKELFLRSVVTSNPMAKISVLKNMSLAMFYCCYSMSDQVYYIEDYSAVAVAEFYDNILKLKEVFCTEETDIDKIINKLAYNGIKKVVFGFTPKRAEDCEVKILKEKI
ncbi:GNAT family N-acetyltransferase [Clostridium felsineum]|uniref:Uncharacterized protein n=1 Tax=Clostridium felsineum TaxID=36839 RepID=A0A1S8M9I0_9CLOT|nr:GNAT family N-acetyltransferase [Clostridium felsineum]URZ08433.1 hypothetical protein CLROS_038150 [Clostridium felsineum]URZ13464.1 hypothetical protein CROST_042300 [Clostridium felsineum]